MSIREILNARYPKSDKPSRFVMLPDCDPADVLSDETRRRIGNLKPQMGAPEPISSALTEDD